MKRVFYMLLLILLVMNINSINAQKTSGSEKLKLLKELSDFNNWPGKDGPLREGIIISNKIIPALSNTIEVKKEKPISISGTEQNIYVKQHSQWKTILDEYIDIKLIFAVSCEAAQEYIMNSFALSSLSINERIARKDKPTIAGVISFSKGRTFVRDNIVVKINAEGEMNKKIETIAKEIDSLLVLNPTALTANQFKPVIKQLEIENNQVEKGSKTKLLVNAVDSQESDLYYFWKLTGGGVDKDKFGNYYYNASKEENKIQILTLIVANSRGYYSNATVELKIK